MAEDNIYVQSIKIRLKNSEGEIMESKFTGLALCSPEQWEEIKKTNLGKAMEGVGGSPIIFTEPTLIDDLITEDSDQHDLIDTIRGELRSNHHKSLRE